MQFSSILLATLIATPLSYAQQAADGPLVPFTSTLPACASQCGPLYDVQGGCAPPVRQSADVSCFCADSRLTAMGGEGTTGVSSICGATSCTSQSDLQAVKNWYTGFCANRGTRPPNTRAGGTATSTSTSRPTSGSSANGNNSGNSGGAIEEDDNRSWIQSHYRWLIMAVILVVGIPAVWIGAWLLRRRHLRKKEREIEMRPPVAASAWGPNNTASYGDGVSDATRNAGPSGSGGHYKEAKTAIAGGSKLKKQKMGWFQPKA